MKKDNIGESDRFELTDDELTNIVGGIASAESRGGNSNDISASLCDTCARECKNNYSMLTCPGYEKK